MIGLTIEDARCLMDGLTIEDVRCLVETDWGESLMKKLLEDRQQGLSGEEFLQGLSTEDLMKDIPKDVILAYLAQKTPD